MPHLIINANHLFLLKKINCLEAKLAILLIKLGDFNGHIKFNSQVNDLIILYLYDIICQ